ncbi:hypothetical protein [Zoogloea sp.]|uniref:hypothetical protein n=1 Tax=Zoogloea sp. TaxID=49181 RepID=UPI00261656BA|nr:hypothetical protein [Zoogloea sp.]
MASSNLELKWEWPAGRASDMAALVKVQSIKPASKGFFGILASPSMANALPEATDVSVIFDQQGAHNAGQIATVRLPGVEARKLEAGSWAALGLLESGRVCLCVQAAPKVSVEELRRWIAGWKCPTEPN